MNKENKPIRVRITNQGYLSCGEEFDVFERNEAYWQTDKDEGDSNIIFPKAACTIIQEPAVPPGIPPGIIAFKNSVNGDLLTFGGQHPIEKDFQPTYAEWVHYHLMQPPISIIHTIRDDKGVEWSVGERVKNSTDEWTIKNFAWKKYCGILQWHVYYEPHEHNSTPFDLIYSLVKLPPSKEQEPPQIDKARLERYVLAAMAGESCATYRGTDWEWATHILNYAIRMMKAVDNYKPEQP